jgi:hypothetical protein
MVVFAWMVWRFVERPGQRMAKAVLTRFAARLRSVGSLLDAAVTRGLALVEPAVGEAGEQPSASTRGTSTNAPRPLTDPVRTRTAPAP